MPEGDTIFRLARRARPVLQGRPLLEARMGPELLEVLPGRSVEGVETYGKHLLLGLDDGRTLRVHLGLGGKGVLLPPEARDEGRAVLRLRTAAGQLVVRSALHCQLLRPAELQQALAHLGPDLLKEPCDLEAIAARARASTAATASELLLDQRVAAGIGNVYKCELLFVFKVHPERPPEGLPLSAIYERARDWLRLNRDTPRRTTTGPTFPTDLYVYDRSRRPCVRCRSPIAVGEVAERVTYWCRRCQR